MAAEKISERIHLKREAYKCILSLSCKIEPADLRMNFVELFNETVKAQTFCKVFDYKVKVPVVKFQHVNVEETDEVVFFYFGDRLLTEEEILKTIDDAGFVPATFQHLLAVARTNFTSKYTLVSLGSRYEGTFSYLPSIHFEGEAKALILAIETNWDKRYAFPAVKKKEEAT